MMNVMDLSLDWYRYEAVVLTSNEGEGHPSDLPY
jgi:hypothetical protein